VNDIGPHFERVHREEFKPLSWSALGEIAWRSRQSPNRPYVRIVRCGNRLLDPDNLAGSCKALVDQLRYAGLIPDDSEKACQIEYNQLQVKKSQITTYVRIDL